ncbi:serine/threonine-protein kinase [Vineibacter terrae]|uniref:serine/threonine-protein kinase n=1 Tax=Vineibacter terrae TaxID=2586908 RepID=UPI002E30596E|nr:serine/threonine-protein kinase [Vineibacter terrae]HEX2887993.1 serine/threonine-protein kinase [Vineibacter terrae]
MARDRRSAAASARQRARKPPQTLPPGTRVGAYLIGKVFRLEHIGVTYRARDTVRDSDVVIREYLPIHLAARHHDLMVLPRSPQQADDFLWGRDCFLAEAAALATLARTPGIVMVSDHLHANGTAYMVMAPVPCDTLAARLARRDRLAPAAIDRLLPRLLDALEQAHDQGVLHLDIKPANIALDAQDQPTLFDFGAARAAITERMGSAGRVQTPGYAAIEQLTHGPVGPATDIHGLAAVLHQCVTGAPPPAADMRDAEHLPPLYETTRGYRGSLLAGIQAGLARSAARRPQSIAAWRSMLLPDTAIAPAPPAVTATSAAPPAAAASTHVDPRARLRVVAARPRTGWRRRWKVALAATLAVATIPAGVAGYYATLPQGPQRPPAGAAPSAESAAVEARAPATAEAKARRQAEEASRLAAEAAYREMALADARAEALARARGDAARRAREQQAQAEARRRAEDQAAKAAAEKTQAEAEARKNAPAVEAALKLSDRDKRRVQVALTALGHDTYGADGVLGSRTRAMISAWQKSRGQLDTGYLTTADVALLWLQAAPALAHYERQVALDMQRRQEEQKRLVDTPPTAP